MRVEIQSNYTSSDDNEIEIEEEDKVEIKKRCSLEQLIILLNLPIKKVFQYFVSEFSLAIYVYYYLINDLKNSNISFVNLGDACTIIVMILTLVNFLLPTEFLIVVLFNFFMANLLGCSSNFLILDLLNLNKKVSSNSYEKTINGGYLYIRLCLEQLLNGKINLLNNRVYRNTVRNISKLSEIENRVLNIEDAESDIDDIFFYKKLRIFSYIDNIKEDNNEERVKNVIKEFKANCYNECMIVFQSFAFVSTLTIILKIFSCSFKTFISALLCCFSLQKFYLDFNYTVTDSFCFETLKLCLILCFFAFIYYFAIYISYVIFIFLSGLFILLLISWFTNDNRFIKFFLTSINFDENTPITSNFRNLVFLTYIFGTMSFIFNQAINSLFY